MIINQSVGFTFIHIPKSAGTSVTQFLSPLNGPFDLEIGGTAFGEEVQVAYSRRHRIRKHSTLAEALATMRLARPEREMLVFTFVRNPYERLSSIFSFLRKWENYNPDLLRQMKGFADFEEFVASGIYARVPGPDNMFRPQCDWIKLNGTVAPSVRFFKIEEIEASLKTIRTELSARNAGIDRLPTTFPHANKSRSDMALDTQFPENLLRAIDEFYADDFEVFGYRKLHESKSPTE
jgi:hypothetical protein